MDPALLNLLRCPVTQQSLRLMTAAEAVDLGLEAQPVLLREDASMYYIFEDHGFPLVLPGTGKPVPGR
jgi:uncharacterized protein YbaR (Trm112 family)